jgi:hypothetical protein
MKTMKRLHIYSILALTSLLALTACQQEDEDNRGGDAKGSALVTLRLGTADMENTTRANWHDDNAEADRSEMMYNWTVLLLNNGQIQYKFAGTPTDANAEIDNVCTDYEMTSGAYTVYSFANISEASLKTVLGISSLEPGTALTDNAIETATATINANGKTRSDLTADDAFGFGSKGIPMSNQQVLEVPAEGTIEKDLIVVRMVAKLEFVFFNATKSNGGGDGEDLTVKSVSISDITKASTGNQKLLPNLNNNGSGHEDEMTFTHGDIKPNLGASITTEEVKYVPTTALSVASTDTYEIAKLQRSSTYAKKYVFYVNETQLAAGKQFELNVELNNGDYRYALVSTGTDAGLTVTKDPANPGGNENATTTPVTETKRSDDWTYIARNDYRVIPIVLDNYRLELVPYDFPAIGVYPASVKTIDANTNLHEILFHDYGHFHLVPHVYRGAAWAGTENNTAAYPWTGKEITFSATQGDFSSTVWTLDKASTAAAPADWTNAFSSFTTTGTGTTLAKDAELTIELNSGTTKFYGAPDATGLPANNVYPTALPVYGTNFDAEVTHTADGKTYSQGDFPMLDAVTLWKPKTDEAYRPYIFGQIAPQDDNADKTVYHEFRVNVYVQGESVARLLIYRFYMHLKQDYGLDPVVTPSGSRLRSARPSCGCHHGL